MMYDINLLTKNKKGDTGKVTTMMFVIGMIAAILLFLFGYISPINQRAILNNIIIAKQTELATFSKNDAEYAQLSEEVGSLTRLSTTLDVLNNNNSNMTELTKALEEKIPKNVTIESMSLESGVITIEGLSPTIKEIAQFVVKARGIKGVLDINFTSAEVNSNTEVELNKMPYKFVIYITLDIEDVLTSLENQAEAATTKGGAENEAQ